MPEERRAEEELTKAKAEEAIALLDKLSVLFGYETFSSQMVQLQGIIKQHRQQMLDAGLDDSDVGLMVDALPMMMSETVGNAIGAIASSMESAIKDPDKLKSLMQQKK